jgi:hypothetical protein
MNIWYSLLLAGVSFLLGLFSSLIISGVNKSRETRNDLLSQLSEWLDDLSKWSLQQLIKIENDTFGSGIPNEYITEFGNKYIKWNGIIESTEIGSKELSAGLEKLQDSMTSYLDVRKEDPENLASTKKAVEDYQLV